jgi:hypothetical protein
MMFRKKLARPESLTPSLTTLSKDKGEQYRYDPLKRETPTGWGWGWGWVFCLLNCLFVCWL